MCDYKVDLVAITETWLGDHDTVVRAKLWPDGYKLLDQGRDGRRSGGTALIFRDSLAVKKVDAGAKVSFEFSEWTVQSVSHDFRVVILYRPQADSAVRKIQNLRAPTLVNDLGQYFVTRIETIQRKLNIESFDSVTSLCDSVLDDSPSVSVPLFTEFENVSTSDVATLFRRSALKSCPLDPMPSRLVSKCGALRPVIAAIIDKSL